MSDSDKGHSHLPAIFDTVSVKSLTPCCIIARLCWPVVEKRGKNCLFAEYLNTDVYFSWCRQFGFDHGLCSTNEAKRTRQQTVK